MILPTIEEVEARRKLPGEELHEYAARLQGPTGRMIYLDEGDGPFGSKVIAETVWHAGASVGEQSGTYFRTVNVRDGMVVWRWGGRGPETVDYMKHERSDVRDA